MAAPQTVRTTLALLLCSAALAGCGSSEPSPVVQGSSAPPPPSEIVVVNHGLDVTHQDESKILAPAELKADETTLVVENPPLQEGVPQPLVSETVVVETAAPGAEASRLAQLEKEVAALRADYNSMMPAFNGLITTNERIKTLLDQLEQKAGVAPAAANKPAEAAPAAPAAEPQASANPAPASGASVISGMRIGEHGDKTRLVLDATAATEYKTDVTDKTLTITLPGAGWTGKESVSGLKSPLVSGWTASAGAAGGVVITVSLKSAAKVVATEQLKAEGKATPRIVIDLAADKAAT